MITEQFLRTRRPKTHAEHLGTGFNGRLALWITTYTGTMGAAYFFTLIAVVGAYAILAGNSKLNLAVVLVSQTFLQLVLLPIILTGQNIQAKAADERAELTFADTELLVKLLNENTFLTNAVRELTKEIHGTVCQPGDRR